MTELMWDGKYRHGKRVEPARIILPFQTAEAFDDPTRQHRLTPDDSFSKCSPAWRNRLIWGDKKYVLPALLPESVKSIWFISIRHLIPVRISRL